MIIVYVKNVKKKKNDYVRGISSGNKCGSSGANSLIQSLETNKALTRLILSSELRMVFIHLQACIDCLCANNR